MPVIEAVSLREMGSQLKLPIKVTKGSMPLQCNIYFPKIFAILSLRKHAKFNLPPLIVLTDFLPINEISTRFISRFFFYKHGRQWRPTMYNWGDGLYKLRASDYLFCIFVYNTSSFWKQNVV